MNSVEIVKAICKERKIPISRLEKDLGYANGYIGQLRKGVLPANRLSEIAAYFNVSISYLLGEEHKETMIGLSDEDVDTLGSVFSEACKIKDITPAFACVRAGVKKDIINLLIKKHRIYCKEDIAAVAQYLGEEAIAEEILSRYEQKEKPATEGDGLSNYDVELLMLSNRLSPDNRSQLLGFAKALLASAQTDASDC